MLAVELFLRRIEQGILDDARHREGNPFFARSLLLTARIVPVEMMLADIGGITQDFVDELNPESVAGPGFYVFPIQRAGDLLDAERAGIPFAERIETKNAAHRLGFLRIDFNALLDARAARLRRIGPIAERSARTIPESLFRVLDHRTGDVLCCLPALIFVERAHDGVKNVGGFPDAQILRNRNQGNAICFQAFLIDQKVLGVPCETRLAMHENCVERLMRRATRIYHPLEFGALVRPRADARVNELGGDFVALGCREFPALLQLIGER